MEVSPRHALTCTTDSDFAILNGLFCKNRYTCAPSYDSTNWSKCNIIINGSNYEQFAFIHSGVYTCLNVFDLRTTPTFIDLPVSNDIVSRMRSRALIINSGNDILTCRASERFEGGLQVIRIPIKYTATITRVHDLRIAKLY